jgi:2,5-dioxopentanoate dehydrogenase
LLVRVADARQLIALAKQSRGQLSATMQIDPADYALASRLLPILERRTGRIVVNPFSHPREVSYASTAAINRRIKNPVCTAHNGFELQRIY